MTDQEILRQFRNEHTREKAFAGLVAVYTKKLYWHVRRMVHDHEDANDVVQNAFIKIWKGLPDFREDSRLYTWLYRIATNEAITFLGSKHRKNSVPLDPADAGNHALKEDPYIDGNALQKKLRDAISLLPDRQKQVFVMRYYDELKYEEMEKILDTSAGALKASFHHAVKKIEKYLTGD